MSPGGGWMRGLCSPFPEQSSQQFGHRGRETEEGRPQYAYDAMRQRRPQDGCGSKEESHGVMVAS